MSTYQPGEIVTVTLHDVRVTESNPDSIRIQLATGRELDINTSELIPKPGGQVTIIRRVPADGPPKAGDVWRDRSERLWFGVDVHDEAETTKPDIRLVSSTGSEPQPVEQVLRYNGPLTLVFRQHTPTLMAADLVGHDGLLVVSPDWNNGAPVRVLHAQPAGERDVLIRYQDARLRFGASQIVVPADYPVTPAGGDQ